MLHYKHGGRYDHESYMLLLSVTATVTAAAAAALGVQDHQEGIAAKVVVDLGASLERLSLAVSRKAELSKVCICMYHVCMFRSST